MGGPIRLVPLGERRISVVRQRLFLPSDAGLIAERGQSRLLLGMVPTSVSLLDRRMSLWLLYLLLLSLLRLLG